MKSMSVIERERKRKLILKSGNILITKASKKYLGIVDTIGLAVEYCSEILSHLLDSTISPRVSKYSFGGISFLSAVFLTVPSHVARLSVDMRSGYWLWSPPNLRSSAPGKEICMHREEGEEKL